MNVLALVNLVLTENVKVVLVKIVVVQVATVNI